MSCALRYSLSRFSYLVSKYSAHNHMVELRHNNVYLPRDCRYVWTRGVISNTFFFQES